MPTDDTTSYTAFLDRKRQLGGNHGFDPPELPPFLFDFQADLVTWALRKGRAALFEDCGMGKTPQALAWCDAVARHTGGRVLIVAPLAVSHQMVREGEKFGIEVQRSSDGSAAGPITVTNYERLHLFDPTDFAAAVCDESSAIKNFDGTRRAIVTEFMRRLPYRLLATATAAPNDYIELGTSSEALGELGHIDMLGRFFKNDQNTIKPMRYTGFGNPRSGQPRGGHTDKWRFKGHAEHEFWRWVASWARALRRPSDLGYDDGAFVLPELTEAEHLVTARRLRQGMLFEVPAVGLDEEREEQRRTVTERCEMVAALVNDTGQPAVAWCHLNDEGKLLAKLIRDAVEVSGSDSDDAKEAKLLAFLAGEARVLVTKPRIAGWGLNMQHCAHMTFFPSHSFESYYQAVRRCWRFGQTRPVRVDIVTTEGGHDVMANLQRKAVAADKMFSALVAHMNDAVTIGTGRSFNTTTEVPSWL